jgi:hypothetical protein
VTATFDLESVLPRDVVDRALRSGRELALLHEDALAAVDRATGEAIAVIAAELFEVQGNDFRTLDYSGYEQDVQFTGDWNGFVASNNSLAKLWIERHAPGNSHRYILTSTSRREWDTLQHANL